MASRDQLNETVLHLQMCDIYIQAAITGQFMQATPSQKSAGLYGHASWSCEVIQGNWLSGRQCHPCKKSVKEENLVSVYFFFYTASNMICSFYTVNNIL